MARPNHPRRLPWWLTGLLGAFLTGWLACTGAWGMGWILVADASPLNHLSAIETTESWARLAPLPVPAWRVHVEVTGSVFTRGFLVEFTAPRDRVGRWIKASPGLRNSDWHATLSGRSCQVNPGGRANFAEVWVSWEGTEVFIETAWS